MVSQLSQDYMLLFLETGMGTNWPSRVAVLCVVKKENVIIFKKVYKNLPRNYLFPGVHAEIVMLEDKAFRRIFKKEQQKLDIILTINYSPCGPCANMLQEFFITEKESVESLTIRFSALYRITEEKQTTGLINLKKAGVVLETMTKESWEDLFIWSFGIQPEKIKKRDEQMKRRLDCLLLSPKMGKLQVTSKKQIVAEDDQDNQDDEDDAEDGSSPKDAGKPRPPKKRY